MEIQNGQIVTAGSTEEQELRFADNVMLPSLVPTFFIEVIAGNIQFASDTDITVDHAVWPAGSKVVMTVKGSLRFKAAAGTDKFVVTV